MKLSLYQRLSLVLFLIFSLIAAIFYVWSTHSEQQYRYESQQNLHLSLAANLARDNPLLQKGLYDYKALQNLFHTLMILGPAFEFYFIDPSGNILTHSSDSSTLKRQRIDLLPIIALTHNQQSLPIYGDDPKHGTREKIFSAAPVFNGNTLQGYLYVIVTGEQYDDAFNRTLSTKHSEFSLLLVCGALVFLFVVTLVMFRFFTQPLRRLINDITAWQNAGVDSQAGLINLWKRDTHNEVHQLGCLYQTMRGRINSQVKNLKNNDESRREILADISHDLRTPLASLQGYIETMHLQNNKLSNEQRQQYMGVALKNAQHLKKLIDQVFELSHLENGKSSLHVESFNLIEFLYDVSAKFTLKMATKKISCVITPSSSNIQVSSDIAKLERILSNLLENAIRHTSEGGIINLVVEPKSDHVCTLSVSDNGSGIKEDELAYIFDARYRASNAIQDEETHNGLGLAITKKLLQILQSDIRVQSVLNEGTRFSFSLNLSE